MYRAVLTLLFGLMLSLSGSASALTFKSDGTVTQKDGTVWQSTSGSKSCKNQDNQITAGELHAYVQQNVIQQSSGSQTPELQGDADRVLVRFQ